MKLIDNIRNKPRHKRTQIIWITAAVVAALLLGVWAIVGSPQRGDGGNFFNTFNNDFQNGNTVPNPLNQNR